LYRNPLAPTSLAVGSSLIELITVTAMLSALMSIAIASYADLRSTQGLRAAAALLETDIQFARSLSLTTGQAVRMDVVATATGGSCYLIHLGPAGSCQCNGAQPPRCAAGAALLRAEEQVATAGVAIAPLARPIVFDAGKGTISPTATIRLHDQAGRSIHQVVNIVGRVRSCAQGSTMPGLPRC
jgi:type IV fimbrial biogenesis protein FimT